jgi:hypothetical protein
MDYRILEIFLSLTVIAWRPILHREVNVLELTIKNSLTLAAKPKDIKDYEQRLAEEFHTFPRDTDSSAHGGCEVSGPKVAKFLDR